MINSYEEEKEEIENKITESLEEIQSICIGADSPDVLAKGLVNPREELDNLRKDVATISNIVEKLQGLFEELQNLEEE